MGRVTPIDAYSRTQHAMDTFADQKMPSYRGFILDMRDDDGDAFHSAYDALSARFGPVSNTMKSLSAPGMPTYRTHYWTLATEQSADAFSALEEIRRNIPTVAGRVSVQVSWSFKFVEPETGIVLPDQDSLPEIDVRLGPGSSLNLTTGQRTSVNAWLLFPFENASPNFDGYVSRFQKGLIFKLSSGHWRLWMFSPKRGWSSKKIVPSWYQSSPAL